MSIEKLQLPGVYNADSGNFNQYLNFVSAQPMLEESDERALFRRFIEQNDLNAVREIIVSHLRFVVHIARGYLGYGLPLEDLVQEGNIGLMKSVKKFSLSKGVRLASFAGYWIKAEIHEFIIKNWKLVKVATTKAQRKLFFNLRKMRNKTGWLNEGEAQTIADMLSVKREEVKEMEARMIQSDCAFDVTYGERIDEQAALDYAPSSVLADQSQDPEAVLIRNHNYGVKLTTAIARLDNRAQDIIRRRWMPEDGRAARLEDLANDYNVSVERIRQIEQAAMHKLKQDITVI